MISDGGILHLVAEIWTEISIITETQSHREKQFAVFQCLCVLCLCGEFLKPMSLALLFCPIQASGTERPIVQTMQAFCHLRPQEREMTDGEQIFGNEPERLVAGHPLRAIEASEVHRTGKSAQ